MSRPLHLTSWHQQLASRFPALPAAVVAVLALYSFGVVWAQVSGLSTVTLFLAHHLAQPYHALRKRLSEFYKEAPAKSGFKQGIKRQDFDVVPCFAPLLRWVLALWSGCHLALAIDVTNLADRFHVLCVSVVVGGVGIPVAWKVLLGGVKEPWGPHWERLLQALKEAVPGHWTVLVLSDRGLESAGLFRFITELGWHPLMRVKKGGKFRPKGWSSFCYFDRLVPRVGGSYAAEGLAYTGEKLPCTLLGCWAEGHAEPWLLLTDLAPEAGNAVWYGLRGWVEQQFKVIKGGGWDWHKTRMDDPGRVERLWLVLAVATLWVVAVGAEDEARERAAAERERLERGLRETEAQAQARRERERQRLEKQREALRRRQERLRQRREAKRQAAAKEKAVAKKAKGAACVGAAQQRSHRVSRRGLAVLKAAWERGLCPLPRHLYPEPWPEPVHSASTLTEQEFLAQPK
jgi:Transposase DDE domain